MSFIISDTASARQVAASLSRSYRQLSVGARRLASKLGMESERSGCDVDALTRSDIVIFKPTECTTAEAMELLRTAGDALERIETLLEGMTGLARDAASPLCDVARRREQAARYQNLAEDINRIVEVVRYGDVVLLDGTLACEGSVRIQSRPEHIDAGVDIRIPSMSAQALGVGARADGAGRSIGTRETAEGALEIVDRALENVRVVRVELEETGEELEASLRAVRVQVQNMSACASCVSDADVALDMLEFVHSHVLRQPSVSLLAQANTPRMAMGLL